MAARDPIASDDDDRRPVHRLLPVYFDARFDVVGVPEEREDTRRYVEAPLAELARTLTRLPAHGLPRIYGPGQPIDRTTAAALAELPDNELLAQWQALDARFADEDGFACRGRALACYRDLIRGKRILVLSLSAGFDAIALACGGNEVVMLDPLPANVTVARRVADRLVPGRVGVHQLTDDSSIAALSGPFDIVWAVGVMAHLPYVHARRLSAVVCRHLAAGARWIEVVYPRVQWVRMGRPLLYEWAEPVGEHFTQWSEWYDATRLQARLKPARFEILIESLMAFEQFALIDLVRRA